MPSRYVLSNPFLDDEYARIKQIVERYLKISPVGSFNKTFMRSDPSFTRRSLEIVVIGMVMITLGTDPIKAIDFMFFINVGTNAT